MKHVQTFLLLIACLFPISFDVKAQNVGVGTSTPLGKLHIKGSENISQLVIDANTVQGNTFSPLIKLRASDGTELMGIHSDSPTDVFIGSGAGRINDVSGGGYLNTFIGCQAGTGNTVGYENTAFGCEALRTNSTGNNNTAAGMNALYSNAIGSDNTAYGVATLTTNYAGNNATAIGYGAMQYAFSGGTPFTSYNVAVGFEALRGSTFSSLNSGNANTAIGYQALWANTSGGSNTAVGDHAMAANSTGFDNCGIGNFALYTNTSGKYNTAIGWNAYYPTATLENTICIGYNSGGIVNANNRIELGNTSVTVIAGQVGFSTYSDARIKDNVREDVPGLAFISKLRPVTYNLNIHRENEMMHKDSASESRAWDSQYEIEKIKMTGFLAQEVEKAAHESGYDFSGVQVPSDPDELYSLRYADFVMPLVKAVQELSAMNKAQDNTIDQLAQRIEKLEALVEFNKIDSSSDLKK